MTQQAGTRPVRTSVKAVIVRNARLLVTENRDNEGSLFLLPGGGQNNGETLHEALQRECMEEIGTHVVIGPLLFVRDYLGKNHEFAAASMDFHQLELMFECSVEDAYVPAPGSLPDPNQTAVCWLPVSSLSSVRFYPQHLVPLLDEWEAREKSPSYLGDVN